MFRKILIPVDGSSLADGILPWVKRILKRAEAEVHLLRVLTPEEMEETDPLIEVREEAKRHLFDLRDALREEGVRAEAEIRTGDPADQILACCGEIEPSLLAMSTHGRTGIGRWVRGSVAERVLRHVRTPVLMVNPKGIEQAGTEEVRLKRILVPLDGSDRSARILPFVEDLARLYEASVELLVIRSVNVHAIGYPVESPISSVLPVEEAKRMVEPYRETVEREGIPVTVTTPVGIAADAILGAIEKDGVDLIAMTTHGRTGFSRWFFGSVAEKVLRHAGCPLLVLRTGAVSGDRESEGTESSPRAKEVGAA